MRLRWHSITLQGMPLFLQYRRTPYIMCCFTSAGARNMWTCEQTSGQLLDRPTTDLTQGLRTALVFHCEFSAMRGPTQYKYIREMDRTITRGIPQLIYPEVCAIGAWRGLRLVCADAPSPHTYLRLNQNRCTFLRGATRTFLNSIPKCALLRLTV